jgi:uncharacterized protein (DUF608 family)
MKSRARSYNSGYKGENLNRVAFPMGGIGAGMICLEGTGTISHVSVRNQPDLYNEPLMFSALHVKGCRTARIIEGAVPRWKAFGTQFGTPFGGPASTPAPYAPGPGSGLMGRSYGLPRFRKVEFSAHFPFCEVKLSDPEMPVEVIITGWSPFIPGDSDHSSLPVAALEFHFKNRTKKTLESVYSFHSANFMKKSNAARIRQMEGGFILDQPSIKEKPWEEGSFAAFTTDISAKIDCAWFRGGWFDPLTMVWNDANQGKVISRRPYAKGDPSTGASLYVPFKLKPNSEKTIRLLFSWHVPKTNIREGIDPKRAKKVQHRPWYTSRFKNIDSVARFWKKNYRSLRQESDGFSKCFYDTTLSPEVIEAVAANLTILKSPTSLRQADGRFWGWEGCHDQFGSCHGTCTHVWNYAQALPHLFPDLERSMRETEFLINQDERGHQNFRASLPIQKIDHSFHAAADGQLGGIMKLYREWRISGDTRWMKSLWPKARKSLEYCISTWDPDHTGTLVEPHHNTYDIEFWGADGMCTSFYLSALSAAIEMGKACRTEVKHYEELLSKGISAMEDSLWNGEYFFQKIEWKGFRAGDPTQVKGLQTNYTPEALKLIESEGPKYQYGTGCLSDGVLGDWIASCCGIETGLSPSQVAKHLHSVFKYNFRKNLSNHANSQRPGYALGEEGGLLLCTWPRKDKPSLPFVYSDEVWTGIEYQVASHLIMTGQVKEGLEIVKTLRKRYDGCYRNPFNEYEWGHWYARAMASYGLLQALSGARYDAIEKVLYLKPTIRGDFRAFIATATGFGTVGIKNGKPFCEVKKGKILIKRFVFEQKRKQVL